MSDWFDFEVKGDFDYRDADDPESNDFDMEPSFKVGTTSGPPGFVFLNASENPLGSEAEQRNAIGHLSPARARALAHALQVTADKAEADAQEFDIDITKYTREEN